jgi:hypothetical protein
VRQQSTTSIEDDGDGDRSGQEAPGRRIVAAAAAMAAAAGAVAVAMVVG